MTLKLNHLHIKTKDPEKTAKFYVDTLGAKIVSQSPNGGYRVDLHGLSLNVSKFLANQTREQKYGMEHIAIDTDELDYVHRPADLDDVAGRIRNALGIRPYQPSLPFAPGKMT